ncbi:4'-phosphopantetheinyl transferase superfamily protein [Streptomyces sp. NPDC085946]|uniref:4'-phosphopantetheinyl transferase superfamily protein n=1 Tax=Streptomyces sp. NPDC085946 TaxID=3365744 RepID=UPI0037CDA0C7
MGGLGPGVTVTPHPGNAAARPAEENTGRTAGPETDGTTPPPSSPATAEELPDPAARLLPHRPVWAAAGLGLGVALASDPEARPAGPAEEAAAAVMPPRRRREFLAGRLAARRALRAVGLDCGEIPRAGRLPVFPPGRAASITHSAGVAVAVARAPGRDTPLGCDLELRPLPARAARLVLREDEEELLRTPGPGAAPWSVTSLFSAKEAAWKALHTGPRALPAGALRTLRDLRAQPLAHGLRIGARADPALAVHVDVVAVGAGVFSTVLGWAGRRRPAADL